MERKFVYLLAVQATDERIVAAEADAGYPIEEADLVEYDDGKIGEVVMSNCVEKDGQEYKFFTLFHAPFEVTGHWSMNWRKEGSNAS